jgi:hypothetical protein
MRDLPKRRALSFKASLFQQRVAAHLRSVDLERARNPSPMGAIHWSVHLYLKSLNRLSTGLQARCILFGEEGYFPDGLVERGPSVGWLLVVVSSGTIDGEPRDRGCGRSVSR